MGIVGMAFMTKWSSQGDPSRGGTNHVCPTFTRIFHVWPPSGSHLPPLAAKSSQRPPKLCAKGEGGGSETGVSVVAERISGYGVPKKVPKGGRSGW